MHKLSIITICYNEASLEKTCESIVNQSWQDFEWVVIDGGSDDETQKIWDKYKYRINKFISEKDSGVYNALNKGIKFASGEYINFMNAGDCFFDNNVLKDVFKKDISKFDVVYGDTYFKSKDEEKNHLHLAPKKTNKVFWINSTLCHQSTFIKSDLFKKYGLYDEKYKIVADWEKWLHFYKDNTKFKHIPRAISYYNLDGISGPDSKYAKLHLSEREEILKQHFTREEIKKAGYKWCETQYTFFERIFSIKDSPNNSHRVVTILGLKFKRKKDKAS